MNNIVEISGNVWTSHLRYLVLVVTKRAENSSLKHKIVSRLQIPKQGLGLLVL